MIEKLGFRNAFLFCLKNELSICLLTFNLFWLNILYLVYTG